MWRTWGCAAAAVVLLATMAPGVAAAEARHYEVHGVHADWVVGLGGGRFRVWAIVAARYRDVMNGNVQVYARVLQANCLDGEDDLRCGKLRTFTGVPEVFDVAWDLSTAEVHLGPHWVEWTAGTAGLALVPYTYFHEEGCAEGSGTGAGGAREASASGSIFGTDVEQRSQDGRAFIDMYYLSTECDPAQWWKGGRSLPVGQWLRRAEISSSLSMSERPSIPTSLALS